MMCYKDRTFCSAKCANKACFRYFDEVTQEAANKWWGSDTPPIAFCDFSKGCEAFAPREA